MCVAQIHVHPVVPVLKETLAVVRAFNARLKRRVTAVMASEARLHWIDIFPALLTPSGDAVRCMLRASRRCALCVCVCVGGENALQVSLRGVRLPRCWCSSTTTLRWTGHTCRPSTCRCWRRT